MTENHPRAAAPPDLAADIITARLAADGRLAVQPNELARLVSSSRDFVFDEIRAGRLLARKVSKTKTLIELSDALAWLRSFPATVETRVG
jgi:hypothetical protein